MPEETPKLSDWPSWAILLWRQSPAIALLLAIIVALLSGWLVTGRTFDREMGRCQKETEFYKGIFFNEREKAGRAPERENK